MAAKRAHSQSPAGRRGRPPRRTTDRSSEFLLRRSIGARISSVVRGLDFWNLGDHFQDVQGVFLRIYLLVFVDNRIVRSDHKGPSSGSDAPMKGDRFAAQLKVDGAAVAQLYAEGLGNFALGVGQPSYMLRRGGIYQKANALVKY